MGATGRIGQLLQAVWKRHPPNGLTPRWQTRRADGGRAPQGLCFLPGAPPQGARFGVVLSLLGVTSAAGSGACGPDLRENSALALAALETARKVGARHVFLASSAAVYGPGGGLREDAALHPASAYGRAKQTMEIAAQDWRRGAGRDAPRLTILRIGNVAGADALLAPRRPTPGGAVTLDRFAASGGGPRRSYIGPTSLARVLASLLRRGAWCEGVPEILNLAAPGAVAMEDLLDADGRAWQWRDAPQEAIEQVVLNTDRLRAMGEPGLAQGGAAAIVAEWRGLDMPGGGAGRATP